MYCSYVYTHTFGVYFYLFFGAWDTCAHTHRPDELKGSRETQTLAVMYAPLQLFDSSPSRWDFASKQSTTQKNVLFYYGLFFWCSLIVYGYCFTLFTNGHETREKCETFTALRNFCAMLERVSGVGLLSDSSFPFSWSAAGIPWRVESFSTRTANNLIHKCLCTQALVKANFTQIVYCTCEYATQQHTHTWTTFEATSLFEMIRYISHSVRRRRAVKMLFTSCLWPSLS